jgi:hypothetical protein
MSEEGSSAPNLAETIKIAKNLIELALDHAKTDEDMREVRVMSEKLIREIASTAQAESDKKAKDEFVDATSASLTHRCAKAMNAIREASKQGSCCTSIRGDCWSKKVAKHIFDHSDVTHAWSYKTAAKGDLRPSENILLFSWCDKGLSCPKVGDNLTKVECKALVQHWGKESK